MTEIPMGRPAQTVAEVEDALLSRWPETRLEPSLDRIRAFVDYLGDPQHQYDVIHITGTNGKTSTARIIDSLLRAMNLRTGRFTSPHLERINERISVDGDPLSDEDFVFAFNDIAPYTHLVDADQPYPLSFFETVVGMAYAAFADKPVDVAIVEVGMGGSWDATNVADGRVAVITPIGMDHADYLGSTLPAIAREKAGIIKPGATVVVAKQDPDALEVIREQAREVGATVLEEGVDFEVVSSIAGVGGQLIAVRLGTTVYDEIFLPLHGAHQAQNAALAMAAVRALIETDLEGEVVGEALANATSPGRLEIVRSSPTIILDAAHNPHGAAATVAALEESFNFDPIIGVISAMADKDVEGMLAVLEPALEHVVITQNSQDRAMRADRLGAVAIEVFGEDRVTVVPDLANALDAAMALSESDGHDSISSGAILVTGSVVTAGEARVLTARRVR
ncbi:MAG TPA: folylpolyglutamate synthase/dihydrofolate synthase family protein [Nocardioides sp.]|nr:folylpolyglutamate synthase/dihydrofolate synthase family protein [Nocardioides sp.]